MFLSYLTELGIKLAEGRSQILADVSCSGNTSRVANHALCRVGCLLHSNIPSRGVRAVVQLNLRLCLPTFDTRTQFFYKNRFVGLRIRAFIRIVKSVTVLHIVANLAPVTHSTSFCNVGILQLHVGCGGNQFKITNGTQRL